MNKEFVSYEQAVALKELGFDEPCFGLWNINNGKHEVDIIGVCKYSIEFKYREVVAPLYQQAFRWLHEQLGFKSSCMPLNIEHREAVLNNNISSLKEKHGNTRN
jgi:hypothetical protein